jgi:hypothetical protein
MLKGPKVTTAHLTRLLPYDMMSSLAVTVVGCSRSKRTAFNPINKDVCSFQGILRTPGQRSDA